LREITHKGLARLVGLYGSHTIDSNNLQILEISSVEPDKINREGLHKGMLEAIMTSIGWFADHTNRAKELAIQNINKTSEAYNSGDQSWSRWLGWVFHFITDWATPYHSSNTMFKYILDSKNDVVKKESENGGVSFWTILDIFLNLVQFKADHDKFEDICEQRWQQNDSIIKDNFIKSRENSISFVDLKIFSEKMDELRAKYENKLLDWITVSSDQEFSLYMTDIAKVMDVACRIVLG